MKTMTYEVDGRIARITLNRPEIIAQNHNPDEVWDPIVDYHTLTHPKESPYRRESC